MRRSNKEQGNFYFLITLAICVVILGSLAIYVYSVGDGRWFDFEPLLTHTTQLSENSLAGTNWVTSDAADAYIYFGNTKFKDPSKNAYDYYFVNNAKIQEVGYWQVVNSEVKLMPTQIIGNSQKIEKVNFNNNKLLMFSKEFSWSPYVFRRINLYPD